MGFVEDLADWLTSCACDQPQSTQRTSSLETDSSLATDPSDPCCAQSEQKKKSITLPFSKHESSRICLAAALNIAQAFEALPYPPPEAEANPNNPLSLSNSQPSLLSQQSASTPRTLPSFACCAMQAAYALLMVCNQAWAMQTGAMPATQHPRKLLAQCEQGLYSLLGTLDNYALAFEAIRGMRGTFFSFFFPFFTKRFTYSTFTLWNKPLTTCVQTKSGNRLTGLRIFSPATFENLVFFLLSMLSLEGAC
jgi:hypothetical protein